MSLARLVDTGTDSADRAWLLISDRRRSLARHSSPLRLGKFPKRYGDHEKDIPAHAP
ncbi:MAG: hypothetical protein ACI9ZV_000560 [Candidatus Azotimanducaceae bacterium]|jgi:hypothetical protein